MVTGAMSSASMTCSLCTSLASAVAIQPAMHGQRRCQLYFQPVLRIGIDKNIESDIEHQRDVNIRIKSILQSLTVTCYEANRSFVSVSRVKTCDPGEEVSAWQELQWNNPSPSTCGKMPGTTLNDPDLCAEKSLKVCSHHV